MHGDDGLDAQQRDGLRRPLRAHRVKAADGQEGGVELAQLGDHSHVAKNVRVAGEVDAEPVLELDDKSTCLAAVDDAAVVRDAA